ncbi:hypothetical protein [Haloferax elongans]|nr:hypothetical protein [Haloferax elongans]
MPWSRRHILGLGGLSVLSGFAGCTSVPFVGTIGLVLRNYTENAHDARIEIRVANRVAFEQTYQLPTASEAKPYVVTEADAVSNIPKGMTYTVFLFLDGTEVDTLEATMDCTKRDSHSVEEEVSIDIGFPGEKTVDMADSQC